MVHSCGDGCFGRPQRPRTGVAAAAAAPDATPPKCDLRGERPVRTARRLRLGRTLRSRRCLYRATQEGRAHRIALWRKRPGGGAMSITNSYEGVRQVVVDNLGGGSITVEPGARQDLVEAWIDAADDRFLEQVQIRQDHDWLRISLPHRFVWSTKAQLRLGVPDGLAYVIKTGSADISISADIGRSKIVSGSGDITVGNAVDLDCS